MKNIIIVAHLSNSIFKVADIKCQFVLAYLKLRNPVELKLNRSLACLDFLWTAKPVQAKIILFMFSKYLLFNQSTVLNWSLHWTTNKRHSFGMKTCLRRKTKTKLGNKNGYFFEIFSSSRHFWFDLFWPHWNDLKMTPNDSKRPLIVFLFWTSVFVPSGRS